MGSKTIGQLSAASAIGVADLIEIEQSGTSKYATGQMISNLIVSDLVATSTESLLATSDSVLMSPIQTRIAFNANNEAPVYACRAWCTFDGTTTSSSLAGTYTRVVGTTQTVCVATSHGMITGNAQYIDFVTGGGSDNSYIVTVIDQDTFTVNTVSTSSILTSTLSLKRCPVIGGNVSSVSRMSTGTYLVNFSTAMPSASYAITSNVGETTIVRIMGSQIRTTTFMPMAEFFNLSTNDGTTVSVDFSIITTAVFA